MIPTTNFTAAGMLTWSAESVAYYPLDSVLPTTPSITNGLSPAAVWPNDLWGTDDNDGYVYRITNLAGVTAAQGPSIIADACLRHRHTVRGRIRDRPRQQRLGGR